MIIDYVINAFFIVSLGCTVLWIIARFCYFIKCIKVKQCLNRKCIFNECCNKYQGAPTREEIEELKKMIDQLSAEHPAE